MATAVEPLNEAASVMPIATIITRTTMTATLSSGGGARLYV